MNRAEEEIDALLESTLARWQRFERAEARRQFRDKYGERLLASRHNLFKEQLQERRRRRQKRPKDGGDPVKELNRLARFVMESVRIKKYIRKHFPEEEAREFEDIFEGLAYQWRESRKKGAG